MKKIRYVYTVIREYDLPKNANLEEERFYFEGVKDEVGEFLYGDIGNNEEISVKMELSKNGGKTWKKMV